MKKVTLILLLGFMLAGCGISVSYLKIDDTIYPPTNSIKVFFEEPQEEYVSIGLIKVSSTRSVQDDEQAVFNALKKRAQSFGAQAIIIKSRTSSFNPWGGLLWGARKVGIEAIAIRFKTPNSNSKDGN